MSVIYTLDDTDSEGWTDLEFDKQYLNVEPLEPLKTISVMDDDGTITEYLIEDIRKNKINIKNNIEERKNEDI